MKDQPKKAQTKAHFFLAYGTVFYEDPTQEGAISSTALNTLVKQDTKLINVASLATIQRSLQAHLFKSLGDVPPVVVDVAIQNIVHLGLSTDDEMYGEKEKH